VRILVVEDNSDTRKTMTRLLHRWGFEVTTANTLESGLAHVEREPFDVILSDIALPDGTGYALISEVRRRGRDVMAIALSGYEYPADVKIAKLTGFDFHLTKPCDSQKLRALLEERIDRTSATKANGAQTAGASSANLESGGPHMPGNKAKVSSPTNPRI
jgi:CheY-like chemotaxis protein